MRVIEGKEAKTNFPIAVVVSQFNEPVTAKLLEGALVQLREKGFSEDKITLVRVPGAIEIPVTAQRLAQLGRYEAVIALGAVIRGQTSHYDYVCQQVSDGCQQVALQNDLPVVFGVLTTENADQAWDRVGGAHGHKGKESVDVAIQMVSLLAELNN